MTAPSPSASKELIHLPILRFGREYRSLDQDTVQGFRGGDPLALVSRANAGLIRRDLRKIDEKAKALRALSTQRLLEICREAGERFLNGTITLNDDGVTQSPEEYVELLSATSGLPHALCRKNMDKCYTVFRDMEPILQGLTRGLGHDVLDHGLGEQLGVKVSYARTSSSLGVVLPSNSPGVNSIWMPAIALKTPVVLKPGREEPWTPLRIIRAFIESGCPKEAFGFYPTDHEGAATVLEGCGRALIFGDEKTTARYAADPSVQVHGPGWSKVLIGEDQIDRWEDHLDVLVDSVVANGGRSCINASSIFVPARREEIADALARRLAPLQALPPEDDQARISAFANPAYAQSIDTIIDRGLEEDGAEEATAKYREGPRRVGVDGATHMLPTVVSCDRLDHPLAKTEFMFPFVSVVQVPQEEMVEKMGPSLVVTAITKSAPLLDRLIASPDVQRLNIGPVPTSKVDWDQPHEGNLFEFLFERRAIQRLEPW